MPPPVYTHVEPARAPLPVAPAPAVKVVEATPSSTSTELAPEFVDKVANAPDYSWLTGELFYIHADKGLWVVRYAPVDKEDRYGGSVVLAAAVSMENFREGDLVTVHGEILNEGRASKYLGGPLYRTVNVKLEERGHH
jgi:hypothetical protein